MCPGAPSAPPPPSFPNLVRPGAPSGPSPPSVAYVVRHRAPLDLSQLEFKTPSPPPSLIRPGAPAIPAIISDGPMLEMDLGEGNQEPAPNVDQEPPAGPKTPEGAPPPPAPVTLPPISTLRSPSPPPPEQESSPLRDLTPTPKPKSRQVEAEEEDDEMEDGTGPTGSDGAEDGQVAGDGPGPRRSTRQRSAAPGPALQRQAGKAAPKKTKTG